MGVKGKVVISLGGNSKLLMMQESPEFSAVLDVEGSWRMYLQNRVVSYSPLSWAGRRWQTAWGGARCAAPRALMTLT